MHRLHSSVPASSLAMSVLLAVSAVVVVVVG